MENRMKKFIVFMTTTLSTLLLICSISLAAGPTSATNVLEQFCNITVDYCYDSGSAGASLTDTVSTVGNMTDLVSIKAGIFGTKQSTDLKNSMQTICSAVFLCGTSDDITCKNRIAKKIHSIFNKTSM